MWHLLKLRILEQGHLNGWCLIFSVKIRLLCPCVLIDDVSSCPAIWLSEIKNAISVPCLKAMLCEGYRISLFKHDVLCFSVIAFCSRKKCGITSEMSVFYFVSVGITPCQDCATSVYHKLNLGNLLVLLDLTLICLGRSLEGLKADRSLNESLINKRIFLLS